MPDNFLGSSMQNDINKTFIKSSFTNALGSFELLNSIITPHYYTHYYKIPQIHRPMNLTVSKVINRI